MKANEQDSTDLVTDFEMQAIQKITEETRHRQV